MPVTVILSKTISRALQAVGAGFNVTVFLSDLRAQTFQSLDVKIDRTRADGAAARQAKRAPVRSARPAAPAPAIEARICLDQFVGSFGTGQIAAADGGAMLRPSVAQFDFGAHGGQQLAGGFDVAHLRNIFQDDWLVGEQGSGHGRQSGILGAADANRAQQRIAAANDKFIHIEILP